MNKPTNKIIIDQQGHAVAVCLMYTGFLVWLLYLTVYALRLHEQMSAVNIFVPWLMFLIMILLISTVIRKLCLIEKHLEMDDLIQAGVLFGDDHIYAYKAIEQVILNAGSASCTMTLEMTDDCEWTFKTNDYSMPTLKQFFETKGLVCSHETATQINLS